MDKMRFSVEINASKQVVWKTLWEDQTLREWAGIIDPGTYMVGDLKEGTEVEFRSAVNGYGVTSLVEKLIPYEYALLRHSADTQQHGTQERDKQWTGGTESYSLVEQNGVTTLNAEIDVPDELKEYFDSTYPKAFNKVKEMAEATIK